MAAQKALTLVVMLALLVFAQTTQAEKYMGAALAVGLAGLGAGIGVGIAGAAAISAMVEKPERLIWYLIFVALAEAVAIYGLLISMMILLIF